MSSTLFDRNQDLRRLRDDGFELSLSASNNHLLVAHVPYVNSAREVRFGTLVMALSMSGDALIPPPDHVVHFLGEQPCDQFGSEIGQVRNSAQPVELDRGLRADRTFSARPETPFRDYHDKVTRYITILEGPAKVLDPSATARTYSVYEMSENESVFRYADTASSRAGISAISSKLEIGKIAIVGVGGTGSYILDLVAKTPVKEIHLFDSDDFSSHNAFRSPGAASIDDLRSRPKKVSYLHDIYDRMRRGIIAHEIEVSEKSVGALDGMEFVFVCMDGGAAKKAIVEYLLRMNVPFIDVGMGIEMVEGALRGLVTLTAVTAEKADHHRNRISLADAGAEDDYAQNIQIAELNALNAALAVIRWKKTLGFYAASAREHFTVYTIDQNSLINEDTA